MGVPPFDALLAELLGRCVGSPVPNSQRRAELIEALTASGDIKQHCGCELRRLPPRP
jgi:hypothetical protein